MMHYWYSEKQDRLPHEYHNFVTLPIAGELVEVRYSECSKNNSPSGSWDDYVYLGSTEQNFEGVRLVPTGLSEMECLLLMLKDLFGDRV